jgi:hypothetical protein
MEPMAFTIPEVVASAASVPCGAASFGASTRVRFSGGTFPPAGSSSQSRMLSASWTAPFRHAFGVQ